MPKKYCLWKCYYAVTSHLRVLFAKVKARHNLHGDGCDGLPGSAQGTTPTAVRQEMESVFKNVFKRIHFEPVFYFCPKKNHPVTFTIRMVLGVTCGSSDGKQSLGGWQNSALQPN
jgi:hypothetical protein